MRDFAFQSEIQSNVLTKLIHFSNNCNTNTFKRNIDSF